MKRCTTQQKTKPTNKDKAKISGSFQPQNEFCRDCGFAVNFSAEIWSILSLSPLGIY